MTISTKWIAQILTAITFVSYIVDIGNLKYIVAFGCIGLLFSIFLFHHKKQYNRFVEVFIELRLVLLYITVLSVITIVMQLLNGFRLYGFQEIIYFITPILLVFGYFLFVTEEKDVRNMIMFIFLCTATTYLLPVLGNFSLEKLLSISIIDSFSPFESGVSLIFACFSIYFMYRKQLFFQILSVILTYLALKRIALISCLFLLLMALILWRVDFRKIKINRFIFWLTVVGFILVPIGLSFMINDEIQVAFYQLTGLDLKEITLSRFEYLEQVVNSDQMIYGLGSTSMYLSEIYSNIHTQRTETHYPLHNDLFKIYVECGLIGTITMTTCLFGYTKRNLMAYVLMAYTFVEMFFNPLLGAGTVYEWGVRLMVIYYINSFDSFEIKSIDNRATRQKQIHRPI